MNKKIARFLTLGVVLVLTFSMIMSVTAQSDLKKGGNGELVKESPNGIYIVRMIDNPVVAYQGDIKGLKATAPKNGKKIDPNSSAVVNYVS